MTKSAKNPALAINTINPYVIDRLASLHNSAESYWPASVCDFAACWLLMTVIALKPTNTPITLVD